MGKNVSRGVMWNDAAKVGIVLGIVPVAYLLLTQLVGRGLGSHAFLAGAVNFLLWLVKFLACIWLMMLYMKKFARERRADNSETFRFGCIVAGCSALIVAAFSLANVLLINPDAVSSQFNAVFENYSSSLDSNTQEVLVRIQGMMPQLTFFSNLIYCFLFGVILSYILSRNIPPRNPFARILDEMNKNGGFNNGAGRGSDDSIDDQNFGSEGEDSDKNR